MRPRVSLCLGIFLAGLPSFAGPSAAASKDYSISLLGPHHNSELTLSDREPILVIEKKDDTFIIRSEIAKVEDSFDPVIDSEGETTGKTLSIKNIEYDPGIIAIVGGSGLAKKGVSASIDLGKCALPPFSLLESDNSSVELRTTVEKRRKQKLPKVTCTGKLNGIDFKIFNEATDISYDQDVSENPQYVIKSRLEVDGNSISLGESTVIWAGDLNGDGKVDLVLESPSNHENVSKRLELWMSSGIKDNKPIRKVATYQTTGC